MARSIVEEPRDPKNTLIVDALNLAFRWKHSGNYYGMQDDYLATIRSLAKSYDCGKIIVTADGGSSKWRLEKFPEYKAKRRELAKKQTEQEQKEFAAFFNEFAETLEYIGSKQDVHVIKYQGVEADDLATYIVENKYALDINDIWMISSDKDWDLLLSEDVSRFSTVTRSEVTYFNWPYPVTPEQYLDYQVLCGDSDVPGIKGIGPVKAKQLIEQYGSTADLYCQLPLAGKTKWVAELNANAENLLLFTELMDFQSNYREAIGEHLPDLEARLAQIYLGDK